MGMLRFPKLTVPFYSERIGFRQSRSAAIFADLGAMLRGRLGFPQADEYGKHQHLQ